MTSPSVLRDELHQRRFSETVIHDQSAISKRVRCRLAMSSIPRFTHEMSCLLRTRLRLAIWIILSGFIVHYLRNLWSWGTAFDHRVEVASSSSHGISSDEPQVLRTESWPPKEDGVLEKTHKGSSKEGPYPRLPQIA